MQYYSINKHKEQYYKIFISAFLSSHLSLQLITSFSKIKGMKTKSSQLFHSIMQVKIVHSLIWLIMASAVVYILYCGVFGIFNIYLYISLALLFIETAVLLLNNWSCPFTHIAQDVKPDWKDGDDLFLPTWLANQNKNIFGGMLVIGVVLLILRVLGVVS